MLVANSDIYTRNEVLRHLAALGCYREVLAIDLMDIEKDAAHHEHVNRALVRNVERGPTADSMQRLPPPGAPEVVLLGRSNVGKSSLANALLGRRALASGVAGARPDAAVLLLRRRRAADGGV